MAQSFNALFQSFRRVIQSSHPVCNTIMLFGVIVCLVSVILLGIDGRFVTPEVFPQVNQKKRALIKVIPIH